MLLLPDDASGTLLTVRRYNLLTDNERLISAFLTCRHLSIINVLMFARHTSVTRILNQATSHSLPRRAWESEHETNCIMSQVSL